MIKYKMWGWKWRTLRAQVRLVLRYRRRGKWPYIHFATPRFTRRKRVTAVG